MNDNYVPKKSINFLYTMITRKCLCFALYGHMFIVMCAHERAKLTYICVSRCKQHHLRTVLHTITSIRAIIGQQFHAVGVLHVYLFITCVLTWQAQLMCH